MPLICSRLSKEYLSRQGEVLALNDLSFEISDEEFVSVVGPSGCGKTTLLKLIAGLIRPTTGKIKFALGRKEDQLKSAMVFQEQGLFPWKNVLHNVTFGLAMRGEAVATRNKKALDFIERVGLGEFTHHFPHELSGGMRQRVALARAFVSDPAVLLMDEPFGALDAQTRLVLQDELLKIWGEQRKTVLFVTHDIEEAIMLSDRILVMTGRPGRILEDIKVPLSRPRDLRMRDHSDILEIKWHIWDMLEHEVKEDLRVG